MLTIKVSSKSPNKEKQNGVNAFFSQDLWKVFFVKDILLN